VSLMSRVRMVRIDTSSQKARSVSDFVAEEKPLHIYINRIHFATIFCSPSDLKELAIGHLLSQGIIRTHEEVEDVSLEEEQSVCNVKLERDVDIERALKLSNSLSRVILSACGSQSPCQFTGRMPKIKSHLSLRAETVLNCVNRLNSLAEVFRKTGGVHSAAIYGTDGGLVAFAEDVGRHNAVDKVIGKAIVKGADLSMCFIALSGRLSGDIVLKVARLGLPIAASLAAPLDSGIRVANHTGVTLIGFVRGMRMNVYTYPKRIYT
jgi:FdhD protein